MAQTPQSSHTQSFDLSPTHSAIVVGVLLNGENASELNDDLDELEALLTTLGVSAQARIIQRRQKLTPRCLLGIGKVAEIRALARESGADMVVFDRELSGPQTRNLEEMIGCRVLDRHGVILDIFARHAQSNQAKTQVEIARLEYLLPRLAGAWTHFQRQKAGAINRGMGEKQIEIDRRRTKERIARLKTQLGQIARERETQRKARRKEIKVALVGYTNTGKTTIMNSVTKAQLMARDQLFATLDSNVKTIDPETRPKILLSDTVGFIRNLPHSLVESFKSTLDEVLEANLLIHVVDVSHERYREQMETTESVLEEIGAQDIPTMIVFNKIDQVDDPHLARVLARAYPGSLCVSALNLNDGDRLREHIYRFFAANFTQARLRVPMLDQKTISSIYKETMILEVEYGDDEFAFFTVQTSPAKLAKLARFRMDQ